MKIGIITIHKSPSYGGSLQCYALYTYLKNKGHDVEIIDMLRPCHSDYCYSLRFFRSRDRFIDKIRAVLYHFKILKSPYLSSKSYNPDFLDFNNKLLYSRTYKSIDELYKNPPKYDIYITGSDQVWNPMQPYLIEPYFLTFVKKEMGLKISYAASVGLSVLSENEKVLFKKWIEDYDYVSVREPFIKDYLSRFVDKEILRVADPTFLLSPECWHSLASFPQEKEKYILLFELAHNDSLCRYSVQLSQESGYKLIVLGQEEKRSNEFSYEVVNTAGPQAFLGYIANASMLITDSFHGTVFAILMGAANFYTYIAPGNQKASRITELLSIFSLSDHLLHSSLDQTWKELTDNVLNRCAITSKINSEHILSTNFLECSIGKH